MEQRQGTNRKPGLLRHKQALLAGVAVLIALITGFVEVIPAVRAFVGLSVEAQVILFGVLLLVFDAAMIAISLLAGNARRRIVSLALICGLTAAYAALAPGAWLSAALTRDETARMPANVANRSTFRAKYDDWNGLYVANADWTSRQAAPNLTRFPSPLNRGIGYELALKPDVWMHYGAQYPTPIQADVITAQFYVNPGSVISDSWVGLGVCERDDCQAGDSAGSYVSIPPGEWTELALDLRQQYDTAGQPLNSRSLYAQVFYAVQAGHAAAGAESAVLVGLDDVVWYRDVGVETIRDQRGPGEILYDFEGDLQGWHVDNTRAQTTTVTLTDERVYRGRGALKLTSEFDKDHYAMVMAARSGASPNGPWLAHVYVPPEDSPEVKVWAKMYTYDGAGLWLASDPRTLGRGWNTLVWDSRSPHWRPDQEITVGIQLGTETGRYRGRIYIDDVQLFEN